MSEVREDGCRGLLYVDSEGQGKIVIKKFESKESIIFYSEIAKEGKDSVKISVSM